MAKRVTIERSADSPGDLVGATEAAEILDVERTRVARYMRQGVMPEPVASLRATRVWLREEVEEVAQAREVEAKEREVRRAAD